MRRAAIALVAVLALPLASCSRGGGDDDAYVLQLDGVATVTTDDGRERLDAGDHRLAIGDRVEVTEGTARLGLPGEGSLGLRAGRPLPVRLASTAASAPGDVRTTPNSTVVVARRPRLVEGDGLLLSGDGTAGLEAGGAEIRLTDGAARVRRATGVTVGVYRGEASVEVLGRELGGGLPAYRQVAVSDSGSLPRRAAPLVFDRSQPDPWDLRYLGEAIDLGEQLERRSLAVTRQLSATTVDAESLESLVPALASTEGFDDGLLGGDRSLGETLVGASIALDGDGSFTRRWKAAFRFREQGADWGLVALDQRAERDSLLGLLDGVLRGVPAFFTAAPVTGGGATPVIGIGTGIVAAPPADGTGATPPADAPPPPAAPPPTPTPTPILPPGTPPLLPPITIPFLPSPSPSPSPGSPTPPPLPPLLADPIAPVTDAVDGLLGDGGDAIGGLIGGTGESVTGVVEGVGGVTGGVGGLLGSATDALLGPTGG